MNNNDKYVVLLVANDYETMELLEHTFAKAGFCVLEATDIEQVKAILREDTPDIIVCDTQVHNVHREELLEQLPDNLALESLPFIYLQPGALGQEVGKHLDLDQYVIKPYDPIALATLAVRTLSQREFLVASAQAADSYTAVVRRRLLEKEVTRELRRIQRYGGNLSLCILEIVQQPNQKAIQLRDLDPTLLDKIGEGFFEIIRSVDLMARVSRNRFIWVMPETDSKEARSAINRLDKEFGQLLLVARQSVPLGIRVGLASAPKDSEEYYELIKLAEQNLQESCTELAQNRSNEPAST